MTLHLQRVEARDLPVMYALLVLCGEHMHRTQGLSHWYPFDAVATHPMLLKFYDRLGYERRGILSFPNPNVKDTICYERTFEDQ